MNRTLRIAAALAALALAAFITGLDANTLGCITDSACLVQCPESDTTCDGGR